MKSTIVIALFAVLLLSNSYADNLVQVGLTVDDYGELYIDGQLEASYDAFPAGNTWSAPLSLSSGWHDIEIIFKNRWGSNHLWRRTDRPCCNVC